MKAARQVPVQSQVSFVVMGPNHLAIVSTHIASNKYGRAPATIYYISSIFNLEL
jgi:hypothetical protein